MMSARCALPAGVPPLPAATRARRLIPLFLVLLAAAAGGGTYVASSFSSSGQVVNVIPGDSLILAPRTQLRVKLYGDSILSGGGAPSGAPDVTVFGPERFWFFWADSLPIFGTEHVSRREVRLLAKGFQQQDTVRVFSNAVSRITYLHADKGPGAFLATFIDNTFGTLHGSNGTVSTNLVSGSGPFSSQCHISGDLFMVSHRIGVARLLLRRVSCTASGITTQAIDTVARASGAVLDIIWNSAVAVDSSGNTLVLWTRGGAADAFRKAEYKYVNASFSRLDSGLVASGVSDPARINYYDESPVVSYARGKFAAATWDNSGILLHLFTAGPGGMALSSARVVALAGAKFPALATNGSALVLAWKGDLNADGRPGVEAFIYPVNDGTVDLTARDTLMVSDPARSIPVTDQHRAALNLAIDSLGCIAATWPGSRDALGCVFARRTVLYREGSWRSPAIGLGSVQDSVRFLPGLVTIVDAVYGTAHDSVRAGTTSNPSDPGAWTPWVSLRDSTALAQTVRGPLRFFQHAVTLRRTTSDSLNTPVVKGAALRWNVQPSLIGLDSVRVGGGARSDIRFRDTVDVFSRRDSIHIHAAVRDHDGDSIRVVASLGGTVLELRLPGGLKSQARLTFAPSPTSGIVSACVITGSDAPGWNMRPDSLFVKSVNAVPALVAWAVGDTNRDGTRETFTVSRTANVSVDQGDSIVVYYRVIDGNDPGVRARAFLGNDQVDSAALGDTGRFVIRSLPDDAPGLFTYRIRAIDPDTAVEIRIRATLNHHPAIDTVSLDNRAIRGAARIVVGRESAVRVAVDDIDVGVWDTLTFRFTTPGFDTAQRDEQLWFTPTRADSLLRVIVTDIFGAADTFTSRLVYPWLALDSVENPGYASAKKGAATGPSLICGSPRNDTIPLTLRNTGIDSMSITGITFRGTGTWLSIGIGRRSGIEVLNGTADMDPIRLMPGETAVLYLLFSARDLSGDGYVHDTVIVRTTDPVHPTDTIPVLLEYNDLPRIVSVSARFEPGKPFWLAKKRGETSREYVFPPHARLAIVFSEPIDSFSADGAVTAYSVYDSAVSGGPGRIPLTRVWSLDMKQLTLSAAYEEASPFFKVMPPPGAFVPTDSIVLAFTSELTDVAATRSGPNALDVNRDLVRDTAADTSLAFRIDSISFSLESVSPAGASVVPRRRVPIVLTFTGPVYPGTIDTARHDNRSLIVASRYGGSQAVDFDSVVVGSNIAAFWPGRLFYYGDSIKCRYRGVTARDALGYPADINGDGIPSPLFDSSSSADDYWWSFRIREIQIASVTPSNASRRAKIHTSISVRFSEKIAAGTVDLDPIAANRSMMVTTRFTAGEAFPLRSISISPDSLTVTWELRKAFFSVDSVNCRFAGFSRDYSYERPVNLPSSFSGNIASHEWHFSTEDAGFYIFPNPYQPSDRRHCGNADAPCGIWFKNLHALLRRGVEEISITIFTMKGFPVYDTKKAGVNLLFRADEPGRVPQWKWDTRNQRQDLVSSGLYLFAVSDGKGSVLGKGTLMIIR